MANLGNTTRPAYVYDAETDTWLPIGVGAHSHDQIPASIVDAKGDLIVGTAADTVQKRTVGADGSYLIADSTQTTGLNWAGPSTIAGKNKLINGDFGIWQKGTSASMTNTNFYLADRWESIRSGYAAGMTVSRQSAGLTGFQYCARIQRDSGNTSTAVMYHSQTIETINSIPLQGQTVTVSFWARAGAGFSSSGTYLQPQIESSNTTDQPYRSVGDGSGTTVLVNSIRTLSTSWQKFTTTATIPANATQVFISFKYVPTGTAGAADYYDLAGVQLELGSTATPFTTSTGTIQGELAACQRYYYRQTATQNFSSFGYGTASLTTGGVFYVSLPQTMRAEPNVIDFSTLSLTDQVSGFTFSGLGFGNQNGRNIAQLTVSGATGLTQYRSYFIVSNNSTSGYLGLSAEL